MIPHRREGEGPGSSQIDPSTGLVVATCYWDDCDRPAPIVEGFIVYAPGTSRFEEVHVPLCRAHLAEALARGRLPRSIVRRVEG